MRPIIRNTLCAFVAVVAAPAFAVQSNYFIKLDGMDPPGPVADKHKNEIEISSWQWGATQAAGKVEHEWKVEEGEMSRPPRDMTLKGSKIGQNSTAAGKYGTVSGIRRADGMTGGRARGSDEKGGTEDINIGVGELQEVGGARTETIGAARSRDAASGQPTGKRQHMPIRSRAYVDQSASGAAQFNPREISVSKKAVWQSVAQPLDRGAVRVKVKFPWVGCRVGAHYPALMLGGGAQRYELQDAIVTSCASASSGGPMEEVSFNYGKVTVRGWDPATKRE